MKPIERWSLRCTVYICHIYSFTVLFQYRTLHLNLLYTPKTCLLGNRNAHTHEPPSILTLETQVLSLQMSSLGIFSNLLHSVCTPLPLRQSIVDCLSICRGNSILLSKVSLLYDRIGKLSSTLFLIRLGEEDLLQEAWRCCYVGDPSVLRS